MHRPRRNAHDTECNGPLALLETAEVTESQGFRDVPGKLNPYGTSYGLAAVVTLQ